MSSKMLWEISPCYSREQVLEKGHNQTNKDPGRVSNTPLMYDVGFVVRCFAPGSIFNRHAQPEVSTSLRVDAIPVKYKIPIPAQSGGEVGFLVAKALKGGDQTSTEPKSGQGDKHGNQFIR